ncbi:hypothetical protein [Halorubrum persicum]|nr:hypothetical protein [Halorubrum persicum]
MSIGTGAFSSVEAERGVEVNVVDDDEAYLGLQQVNRYLPTGSNTQLTEPGDYQPNDVVQIKNQFSDPLDLTVNVSKAAGVVSDGDIRVDEPLKDGNKLGIGDDAFVAVTCGDSGNGQLTLSLDGTAGGATVEVTRQFAVSCLDVRFNGNNGNAVVEGVFTDLPVTVVFESGTEEERTISSNSNSGTGAAESNEGAANTNRQAVLHPRNGGEGGNDAIEQVVISETVFKRS